MVVNSFLMKKKLMSIPLTNDSNSNAAENYKN